MQIRRRRQLASEELEPRRVLASLLVTSLSNEIVDDGIVTLLEAVHAANVDGIADALEGTQRGDGDDTIILDSSLARSGIYNVDAMLVSDGLRLVGSEGIRLGVDIAVVDSVSDVTNFEIDHLTLIQGTIQNSERVAVTNSTASLDILGSGESFASDINGVLFFEGESPEIEISRMSGSLRFDTPSGELAISDSEFSDSSYGIYGRTVEGKITISRSTITRNVRHGARLVATGAAEVRIENSSFIGNGLEPEIFGTKGGGIRVDTIGEPPFGPGGLDLTIESSTFSGNSAEVGGALYMASFFETRFTINNSTFVGNTAINTSGSIHAPGTALELSIQNSLLTGNVARFGRPDDLVGDLMELDNTFIGYSVSDPIGTEFENRGNMIGTPETGVLDPLVMPLADNGGPTLTHGLSPLSPVIDAGDPNFDGSPEFDQRGVGFDRVVSGRIDMGAVEFQGTNGDLNGDRSIDCLDVDLLVAAVVDGNDSLEFDLNGDGNVTAGDVTFWVTTIYGTLLGDATLDGRVDVSDFNIWNANKFTSGTGWCDGDFNADGVVDVADFNIWNANKFSSVIPRAAKVAGPAIEAENQDRYRLIDAVFGSRSSSIDLPA